MGHDSAYYTETGEPICWHCVLEQSTARVNRISVVTTIRQYSNDPKWAALRVPQQGISLETEQYYSGEWLGHYVIGSLPLTNTVSARAKRVYWATGSRLSYVETERLNRSWSRAVELALNLGAQIGYTYRLSSSPAVLRYSEPLQSYSQYSDSGPYGFSEYCYLCHAETGSYIGCAQYAPDAVYCFPEDSLCPLSTYKQWCNCDSCISWRKGKVTYRQRLLAQPRVWQRLCVMAQIRLSRAQQRLLCGHSTAQNCTCLKGL